MPYLRIQFLQILPQQDQDLISMLSYKLKTIKFLNLSKVQGRNETHKQKPQDHSKINIH